MQYETEGSFNFLMYTKTKIDRDTRTLILKYIRKYDSYKKEISAEREAAIYRARKISDMPHGSGKSDPTYQAIEALARIDGSHKAKVVKAIDEARRVLALDIPDDEARAELCRAIWLSCENGKIFNFDAFAGRVACERRQFYYYKNEFISGIKMRIGV